MRRSLLVAAAITDIWIARVIAVLAIPALALAHESTLAIIVLAASFLCMAVGCAAAASVHRLDAPPTAWWTLALILAAESVLALTLI